MGSPMALNPRRRSFQLSSLQPDTHLPSTTTTAAAVTTVSKKVPVLYYLSRNGNLEHPHFVDVSLSSPHALFLRDVINRLNCVRGEGMASSYSWSFKRSYRNGFVWQDLTEDDLILPSSDNEYILKGSELLQIVASSTSIRSSPSPSPSSSQSTSSLSENRSESRVTGRSCSDLAVTTATTSRRSSFHSRDYKVYKTTLPSGYIAGRLSADASTQTGDESRRGLPVRIDDRKVYGETEMRRGEISPPCCSSSTSTEILETVDKSRDVDAERDDVVNRTAGIDCNGTSGRMKVTTALMQLIACGTRGDCDMKVQQQQQHVQVQGKRLSCDVAYRV